MKKYIASLCMSFALFTTIHAAPIRDVDDYVLGTLIQLFYPFNDAYGYESIDRIKTEYPELYNHLRLLKQRIKSKTWWLWNKSSENIDAIIYEQIELFVEQVAFDYAHQAGASNASRIAATIAREVKQIYGRTNNLARGVYKNFLGESLQIRVAKAISIQPLPTQQKKIIYQPSSACQLFSTDECCICFDTIINPVYVPTSNNVRYVDTSTVRVAQYTTCGHAICLSCAEKNHIEYKKNTCAMCRATVVIDLLKKIIAYQKTVGGNNNIIYQSPTMHNQFFNTVHNNPYHNASAPAREDLN